MKAQKEFLNGCVRRSFPAKGEGVSVDTPTEEYSSLSQKDPQPEGRQILMDSDRVANPVTARNGAAPGVCSLSALHNPLSRAICQFLEVPIREPVMEQGSKDSHVSRLLSRDMGRIRVAVAGLGKMGTYHVQALRRLAKGESEKYYKSGLDTQIRKLELCGLCDPDPEKSRRLAPDLPCFTDWQVLLAKASPDFVVIASPTETHFPLALQSLEAGVHTFVEKPLVTKLGEFKILNDAASSNGCRLISGHVERYNPVAIKLRTMLSEKLIDVAGYRFQRSQPRDARIPDDIVTDKIVHDLDLAQYFFGAIIYYHMVNSKRADGRIQEATVFLRHASGVEGTLFVSWLIQDARKCREIRISCRDGSCMLGDFADKKLTMDGKALSCDVPSWVKPDNNQIKDELADFVSYCILPDPDMPVFQPLLQTWEIKDSIAIIEDLVRWTQSPGDTDCRQEQEADDDKICKR